MGSSALWTVLSALSVLLMFSASSLHSQIVSINNDFVAAHVHKDQKSARFWISSGPKNGYHRFMYHGSKAAQSITSNVVFRITEGVNEHYYYCNTTPDFGLGGRPMVGPKEVDFRPYDSIRVVQDTIEVLYKNLHRYDITMRFVAEKPRTIYDDGADILLEFEYKLDPNAANNAVLGIFLMLDGDNGAATESSGGQGGDYSSIMTSEGYYISTSHGRVFRSSIGPIPEFYHVGNFEFDPNVPNDLLPIHRLRGVSNAGLPLNPPDVFAVGNWRIYRTLAWNPFSVQTVGDVATAMQWERLEGTGKIRTAFGTNSRSGNNLFHCRDSALFADIRCVRLIEQKEEDGEFTPSRFAVEMWLTNTGDYDILKPSVRLTTPIFSEPDNTERGVLDPSTPALQAVPDASALLPGFTHKFTWYVSLNPASQDTLIHLQFEVQRNPGHEFIPFYFACSPLITVRPFKIPPCDTMPPVIERLGSGRDTTAFWDLQTFDRHTDFDYDTGLDTIEILANDGNNFRLALDPTPYNRCDVNETVKLRAEVIDTSKRGRLVFRVRDCQKGNCVGNIAVDSIIYNPRPDLYKPTVLERDSVGSWDAVNYPCNARIRTVTVLDNIHQNPQAGDYGLGTIEPPEVLQNFKLPVITDQRGGTEIRDFDSQATIMLEVDDTLFDAEAQIRVVDYAGNDTVLFFSYCTIDDFLPPEVGHRQNSSTEWDISSTDSAEWDRGLFEVEVVSNLNNNIVFIWPDGSRRDSLPEISKGAKEAGLKVEVVNKCEPAELILEFRDTYYANDPENHRRFDTIRYEGIPDELAPNILIRPGFDGTTYTFDIDVNDIHYVNGDLFECDRGLETVVVTHTSNVRVRTPLTFVNLMEATVTLEIIDTLAIDRIDTICVTAIDSAGNRTDDCAYWPSAPDGKSPVFIGRYERNTGSITGTATDNRQNDRGLGSVTLLNATNLDNTFGLLGLLGQPTANVTINATDPDAELAGEIVIQDRYGEIINSPEDPIHTVVIPFRLPVARIGIRMPELIETESDFEVAIVAENDIDGDLVRSLTMELQSNGPAVYLAAGNPQPTLTGNFTVTPLPGDRFLVRYDAPSGERISSGDMLGSLRFHSVLTSKTVESFFLKFVAGTGITNDDQTSTITVRKVPTDPLASQLTLPSPLLRIAGDSMTYINGDCNRVLGSAGGAKPNGVAILAIEPQPIRSGRNSFTAVLRGLADEGGNVEWLTLDGRRIGLFHLQGGDADIIRHTIPIPEEASAGVYFLRVTGKDGTDSHRIIIIE